MSISSKDGMLQSQISDMPHPERASPFADDCPANHQPGMSWNSKKLHPTRGKKCLGLTNIWLIAIFSLVVPCIVAIPLFTIPLGEPDTDSITDKLVYLLFTNPLTWVFFTFTNLALFVGCLDESRPWAEYKAYLPFCFLVYCLVTGIMFLIYPFTGTFPAMGLIPMMICVIFFCVAIKYLRNYISICYCIFYTHRRYVFVRIFATISIWMLLLAGYIILFTEVGDTGQSIIAALVGFILMFVRKYFLCVTEPLPIELAMIISGFMIQNCNDLFFTIAYPSVEEPDTTYPILFAVNLLSSFASLLFLTNWWFRFRVWIKQWLKSIVCCQRTFIDSCCFCDCSGYERGIKDDLDADDRGQSRQQPGYRRRQIQFFIFKQLSQISANIFYLCFAPAARYGPNSEYFSFGNDAILDEDKQELVDDDEFRWSLIFAAVSVGQAIVVAFIGYLIVLKFYPEIVKQLRDKYDDILLSKQYYGFIALILTSNSFLTMSWSLAHNRIYFFRIETDDDD